jgi:hypothetical protein
MSFNTVVTISAITEVVVLLGIALTLLNAFSEGKLAALVVTLRHGRRRALVPVAGPSAVHDQEWALKRAA